MPQQGLQHRAATYEIKQIDFGQRVICGYANVMDMTDEVADIVDAGAFTKTLREKHPVDVGVFVGHDTSALPIGVPLLIRAEAKGLYTETRVFDGPLGDQLLATARELQAAGSALGMSIGYRTRDARMERVDGKLRRRLLDLDLLEYSYAARQTVANPRALVVGVKQRKAMDSYSVEARGELFAVMDDDGDVLAVARTADEAQTVLQALRAAAADEASEPPEDDAEAGKGKAKAIPEPSTASAKTDDSAGDDDTAQKALSEGTDTAGGALVGDADGEKAEWTASYVNDLPDSAFLYIAPGGTHDADGRTVPRDNRYFPYKDASGAVDLPHLRNALARIPQSDAEGLNKDAVTARARRLLDSAQGGSKTLLGDAPADAPALTLAVAGYALLDLAETAAADLAAFAALAATDQKAGRMMSQKNLDQLHDMVKALGGLHSGLCDMQDGCPLMANATKTQDDPPADDSALADVLARMARQLQLVEV